MEKEMYLVTYSYRDRHGNALIYTAKAVFESRESAEAAAMQRWNQIASVGDTLVSYKIDRLFWYK